jgi:hypothetical protein
MIKQGSPELGALESTHHVRRRGSGLFITIFTAAIAVLVVAMIHIDLIVCSAIPILILIWVVLEFAAKRRTELAIYENGLIYRGLFKTHQFEWDKIVEFGHNLDDGSGSVQRQRNQSVWLVAEDGRSVSFRVDLADIHDIVRTMAVKIFGQEHVDHYSDDYK